MDTHGESWILTCGESSILSMITNEINPDKIVEITIQKPEDDKLSILGIFIKVACHIARGGTLEVIGKRIEDIKKIYEIQPQVNSEKNQIVGSIIYIDNFGNVVSNISKSIFQNIGKGTIAFIPIVAKTLTGISLLSNQ